MVNNHEAALIAEVDAKSYLTRTVDRRTRTLVEWVRPEGVVGYYRQYCIPVVTYESDTEKLSEDISSFVNANVYQYYVCINTWLMLIKAHNPIGADIVEDRIRKDGLLRTIDSASEASLKLIRGEAPEVFWSTVIRALSTADALEVLRFAKRFTVKSTVLETKQKYDFLETNRRMGLINQELKYTHVVYSVRKEMARILRGYKTPEEYTARFTNGAVADNCGKTKLDKILAWASQRPDFGDRYYFTTPTRRKRWIVESKVSKYQSVPKSYKTYRGIAMEPLTAQSDEQALRGALESAVHKNAGKFVDVHDQTKNGLLACNTEMATIDMSSASDSMSLQLMRYILPYNVWYDIDMHRSRRIRIDGHDVSLNMISTMGNGYTFILEFAVFLAICRAAVNQYSLYTSRPELHDQAYVYGDDCIIPSECYETVVDYLQMLGFIVNEAKSYADGLFRESCGFDWYDGDFVSSMYWPRKYIFPDKDYMSHLVSLQNRIVERGGLEFYWEAARFLSKQVQRVTPAIGIVNVEEYIDYNLNGKCLVGAVSTVIDKEYERGWGLKPGDGLSYRETRHYVNALVPKMTPVFDKETMREILDDDWVTPQSADVAMYLFMEFLREGPYVSEDITPTLSHLCQSGEHVVGQLEITESRLSRSLRVKPDGFEVTRIRLF
jgi:hypothetical protein